MRLQPWIALEAHQAALVKAGALVFALHEDHDVAVRLLASLKALLLHHLRVVDEADELPLTQMDHSLRRVVGHVDDSDFLIAWRECLVGQKWIVYYPRLRHGLLRVVKALIKILQQPSARQVSAKHVQPNLVTSALGVEDGAEEPGPPARITDKRRPHMT